MGREKRRAPKIIRLGMVFHGVREGCQKQGIWAGKRRALKIIDLDTFRYGFP